MKNSLFLLGAAAVVALSSCSQSEVMEVAENRAIGFDAFVGKSTRVTDDVTLANLKSFELYGWRTDTDGDKQIFNQQEIKNDNGVCTYSPLQYWEANYKYNFEAIAPAADGTKVAFAANKTGGTITFVNDGETDLIYAKAEEKTTGETISETPGAVSLTFKHLLSRVKFTFTNGFPSNAAAKITVSDVKISNTYASATITPATGEWGTYENANKEITFKSENVADVVATASEETEHMYLIPHTSPSYTLSFNVTLDQNGATTKYSHETTITTAMAKGNSYNFTATLTEKNIDPETQLFPIEFTASETPWTDFTDGTVDIPSVQP